MCLKYIEGKFDPGTCTSARTRQDCHWNGLKEPWICKSARGGECNGRHCESRRGATKGFRVGVICISSFIWVICILLSFTVLSVIIHDLFAKNGRTLYKGDFTRMDFFTLGKFVLMGFWGT